MACTDGGVPYPPSEKETLDALAPQMLCAICTVLESYAGGEDLRGVVADVDWHEAGVTKRQFMKWWKLHKAEDAERRRHETQTEDLRQRALAKLTDEERRALGV